MWTAESSVVNAGQLWVTVGPPCQPTRRNKPAAIFLMFDQGSVTLQASNRMKVTVGRRVLCAQLNATGQSETQQMRRLWRWTAKPAVGPGCSQLALPAVCFIVRHRCQVQDSSHMSLLLLDSLAHLLLSGLQCHQAKHYQLVQQVWLMFVTNRLTSRAA